MIEIPLQLRPMIPRYPRYLRMAAIATAMAATTMRRRRAGKPEAVGAIDGHGHCAFLRQMGWAKDCILEYVLLVF